MNKNISNEELAKLEPEIFTGEIYVADNAAEAERATNYLAGFQILGFDTETRPSFYKGSFHNVALVQLSTENKCFLFRLNGSGFFPSLVKLLSNPAVKKVGLSLCDDFSRMAKSIKFEPQGFIDLQKIVKYYGINELGLAKIYALVFGKKISKRQRLTNWEANSLTNAQKQYAALDAWACLNIYKKLCNMPKFTSTEDAKSQ
ncbi:MAG: 3'-5' exonuclease domain-containing protein 2 [Dysgonamonadaceae bacterium]|jgi:ribonuclease D|nr:3'-5' exonuclease domain-containing protein 2 [Dysgonamonadaceae bacterium]